ncbi:hypothetical protein GPECTOR_29g109 [Gonium pectorale]|uniref:ABC transporter domain-containing protein n=1 Tax=Gonium pectorale TaxID=33097 RepID=A0A150GEE3_GONPE|nr:hypothetical protein GPECTOR_29g109 [Gonium pectorale]|eukprot:KXZ48202.1 hypothetical protein GPECTOR_29g109 [Gonium pectorale]
MDRDAKKQLLETVMGTSEQDNTRLMQKVAQRLERVGLSFPGIEVRWKSLTVEADVATGAAQVPTLLSAAASMLSACSAPFVPGRPAPTQRRVLLNNVSGALKPGRMCLLLGPPGSGKTTLMKTLANQLHKTYKELRFTGSVTYNGLRPGSDFVTERAATYVSQQDTHIAEMTVAETLTFASESLGPGLSRHLYEVMHAREVEAGIEPDPDLERLWVATFAHKRRSALVEMFAKLLGLDHVMDTVVGNELLKGISGGQRRRVTCGEMAVGLAQVMFLDEISTGLDSASTLIITKALRNLAVYMNATMLVSLLQPSPEVYELFDEVMVLSHGRIVFQGPTDQVFEQSPAGKELKSTLEGPPHRHPLQDMVLHSNPYAQSGWHMMDTTLRREILLLKRNKIFLLAGAGQIMFVAFIVSTSFIRLAKNTFDDANLFLSVIFFSLMVMFMGGFNSVDQYVRKLPVFFKQRDHNFYNAASYTLNGALLRIPEHLINASVWSLMVYFSVGFTLDAGRFFIFWLNLVACGAFSTALFQCLGAVMRNGVLAQGLGAVALMLSIATSGFPIARTSIPGWWIWLYWISPMSWTVRSMAITELTSDDWADDAAAYGAPGAHLGLYVLKYRGFHREWKWVWAGIGAELAIAALLTWLQALALARLPPPSGAKPPPAEECPDEMTEEEMARHTVAAHRSMSNKVAPCVGCGSQSKKPEKVASTEMRAVAKVDSAKPTQAGPDLGRAVTSGTVSVRVGGGELRFDPMALAFTDVSYHVPQPKGPGELRLLHEVSGSFRPGVLTALMGASGAGKTTLMDVLAGRKTGGRVEGRQLLNGHPKRMATFARVMGYVEQFDVHTPQLTVLESLLFSARLRLPTGLLPDRTALLGFVGGVMELVELAPLAGAQVGYGGSGGGLSTEARKRLTIAVELVANPSIVFMDEPTSGLDARAASLVMRAVRNTVNTGRTVVCTIHQPSREIFEAFDELLLLKPGGRVIFNGPMGQGGANLIEHFHGVEGVPRYDPILNPADWMLDAAGSAVERRLGVDFADVWAASDVSKRTAQTIEECSRPASGSSPLSFGARYAVPMRAQFAVLMRRALVSYWRNPPYNVLRFLVTLGMGIMFGTLYWDRGNKRTSLLGVLDIMGALYSTTVFMGISNCLTILPVVNSDRAVFYRERASGMFHVIPYVLSQGLAEMPYIAAQSILYSIIVYFTIQFEFTAVKYCWFLLFFWLNLMAFTFFGVAVMSLLPAVPLATSGAAFFLLLWNLYCGFLVYKRDIKPWWIWAYYFNPATYTIYGVVTTQLGDAHDQTIALGPDMEVSVAGFTRDMFDYKYEMRGWLVLIMVGFVVGFRAIACMGLSFLNFQKR